MEIDDGPDGSLDSGGALAALVRAAVRSVPGVDAGGVTLTEDGRVGTHAPSTEAVRALDRLQGDWYEGPCITAADAPSADGVVLADDLDGVDALRWPGFARYALDAGYHSILSIGLGTAHGRAGSLNLYAGSAHAFDAAAREVAGAFAVHAAALVHGDAGERGDRPTPTDRDLVAQGVGVLVGRLGLEDHAAFAVLVQASDESGLGMAEVARRLSDAARRGDVALPLDVGTTPSAGQQTHSLYRR